MNRKMSWSSIALVVAAAVFYLVFGPKRPIQPQSPAPQAAAEPAISGKSAPSASPAQPASQPGLQPRAGGAGSGTGAGASGEMDESAIHFGVRSVPDKPQGTIRLATYNIENLYDTRADGKSKATDAKPEDQKVAAAAALHKVNADVLALEEIESKEALIEFRDMYLKDMGYTFVSSLDAGDGRGIEQSVLSRFPVSGEQVWLHAKLEGYHSIDDPKEHIKAGTPLDLKRSPLHVTVTVPAETTGGKPYSFTLFVMHHKAGKQFGYWRTAESQFILGLVKQQEKSHPGERIVVLGDFNATDRDESVQTYVNGGLVDAFADLGRDSKYITHQSGRVIDHMMMTPSLKADVVGNTRFVLGMPLKPQKGDWDTMPTPRGYASDHLPVAVDLKVR